MAHHITDSFIARQLPKLMAGKNERTFTDSETNGFALKVRRLADSTLAGTFYALWYLEGGSKIRKQKAGVMGVDTADDARVAAEKILLEVKQGNDPVDEKKAKAARPTFDDLRKDFEEGHVLEKAAKTQVDYLGKIRRVIAPDFMGKFVADITSDDVDALRRKYRHKPTELNGALAILSKMMNVAIKKRWRTDNPVKQVERLKLNPKKTWADEHDLPKYLEALAKGTEPVHELLRFVTLCGWRISEARLLRKDEIDPLRQTAIIHTKTGETTKHLSDDAFAIIRRQPHNLGYVFSNVHGAEPIGYKGVREALDDVCKAAKIKRLTPHSLRRTAATWSAAAGGDIPELMQSFGWRTAQMAADYIQSSQNIARKGVERTAKIFRTVGKAPVKRRAKSTAR